MTQPPAGWYPAPESPEEQRYWDGSQWLDVPAPPPVPERAAKNKTRTIVVGVVAGGLLLAGAGVTATYLYFQNQARVAAFEAEDARNNQFTDAARSCDIKFHHFELSDNNNTIVFRSATKPDSASAENVVCFLDEIGAPASLKPKLEQTRSLDGTRQESWNEFETEWTYHPDAGLNIIVERTSTQTEK